MPRQFARHLFEILATEELAGSYSEIRAHLWSGLQIEILAANSVPLASWTRRTSVDEVGPTFHHPVWPVQITGETQSFKGRRLGQYLACAFRCGTLLHFLEGVRRLSDECK